MPRSPKHSAFTLVELMISLAIALILVLGINSVFKTTAQTVGVGNSTLAASRDARTVMAALLADLNQIVPVFSPQAATSGSTVTYTSDAETAPCLIIHGEHTYAFRNFTDREGAADPSPTTPGQPRPYVDTNLFQYAGFASSAIGSVNPANTCPVPFIHFRSHRIDKIGFFGRGVYQRQTSSDDNMYVSPNGSQEAWVVYGHVQQPSNYLIANPSLSDPKLWYSPGDLDGAGKSKNDNNAFGSDWILGRQAILLTPNPDSTIDPNWLKDAVPPGATSGSPNNGLTPLTGSFGTYVGTTSASGAYTLNQCRLDVGNISMKQFGSVQRAGGLYQYYFPYWWVNNPPTSALPAWYDQMLGYRMQVSPYLMPNPTSPATTGMPKITPYGMAKASPSIIRGCSQFIVEYAGNYYTKYQDGTAVDTTKLVKTGVDANGNPILVKFHAPLPDPKGTLDFYQYRLNSSLTSPVVRATRWYGFPRVINPSLTGKPALLPSNGDVAPLRDVLASLSPKDPVTKALILNSSGVPVWIPPAGLPTPTNPTWADAERFSANWILPSNPNTPSNWLSATDQNYWTKMAAANDAPQAPGAPPATPSPYIYNAAWGPDTTMPFPKLIRITIAMDDHEGRLNQPRLFEFIYQVSQ